MIIDLGLKVPGPKLEVHFYGTRGSTPVANADFLEFGGNTTCVALMSDGIPDVVAILDAGTGIRQLGKDLRTSKRYAGLKRVSMLFTHFHWDHIQGFPFFDPAYDQNIQVNVLVMGVDRQNKDIRQIFSDQMQELYFPVKLDDMGSDMEFIYPDSDIRFDTNTLVTVNPHNHPGGCWGYRLEQSGRTLVFCTDVEHGDDIDMRLVEFAQGADLLIHDAQYTSEELARHKGWGHSSYDQALKVAELAGVKYLVMTHHDPDHDDKFLRERENECQAVMPNCALAREGMVFLL